MWHVTEDSPTGGEEKGGAVGELMNPFLLGSKCGSILLEAGGGTYPPFDSSHSLSSHWLHRTWCLRPVSSAAPAASSPLQMGPLVSLPLPPLLLPPPITQIDKIDGELENS